eukprot:1243934-Pyramimonas_sp.AAC.2
MCKTHVYQQNGMHRAGCDAISDTSKRRPESFVKLNSRSLASFNALIHACPRQSGNVIPRGVHLECTTLRLPTPMIPAK